MVGGGAVVGGTDVVGASVVLVVSGGGVVVATVVCGGGAEVGVARGAVVLTGGWLPPVVPWGRVTTVATELVVESAGVDDVVVEDPFDVVVGPLLVVVGRTVVDEAWVATCCLGERSLPVISSTRRAVRATAAMA